MCHYHGLDVPFSAFFRVDFGPFFVPTCLCISWKSIWRTRISHGLGITAQRMNASTGRWVLDYSFNAKCFRSCLLWIQRDIGHEGDQLVGFFNFFTSLLFRISFVAVRFACVFNRINLIVRCSWCRSSRPARRIDDLSFIHTLADTLVVVVF